MTPTDPPAPSPTDQPDRNQPGKLAGRRALVTGASRGIGRAITLALATEGADVALLARSRPDLDKVADEVRALGREATIELVDVTDPTSVETAVHGAIDTLGGLDVLVNNSGVIGYGTITDTTPDEWDRIMDTNLRGTFLVTRAAGPALCDGGGKVINVASNFGLFATPGYTAYCASKAGLLHMTRVLALEWARHDVQVNAIAPGYVATDLNAGIRADDEVMDKIYRRIPARRMAEPDELGPLAVLLASADSDFITGGTFTIDGGQACR